MEVGYQKDVKIGAAQIYTVTSSNRVQTFDISITNLKKQNSDDTKGISFKVTDKNLLAITNGIVQGMWRFPNSSK